MVIGTGRRLEGTTEETTEATTSEDDRTPIGTKGIACKVTSKATRPLQETHRTHASNAEKWDTSLGIVQNAAKEASTIGRPTSLTSTTTKASPKPISSRKTPLKPFRPNSTPYPWRIEKNSRSRWEEGIDRIFPQP